MTEEEKQLENYQASAVDSLDSEEPATEPVSAAPHIDQDATLEQSSQTVPVTEADAASVSGAPGDEFPEDSVDHETINQLAEEVESLKIQLEDRTNQYMRVAADFDNFRKRAQKEKHDLEQQAKRNTLSELLPVVDSFERARSHIKPQTDQEAAIQKSYQGVYKQLVDCLKRIGVSPMRPEGKAFDPNLHEAVMREETDQHPEGTVIEELMRGYLLGERVLRHALVKVATAPEASYTSEDGNSQ